MATELPILGGTDWGGSKLKAFQKCKRYYWLGNLKDGVGMEKATLGESLGKGMSIHHGLFYLYQGLIAARGNNTIDAHIAAAIHATVEHAEQGLPSDVDKAMYLDELISCMDQYCTQYKEELYDPTKGMQPIVAEVPISLQVGGFVHTGRLDLLGTFGGYTVIPDHKTTGMDWNRFFKRWKFDLSLRGYVLAHWKHTGKLLSVLINGIRFKGDKAMTCEFQRDLIHYDEDEMVETEAEIIDLRKDIASRDPKDRIQWPKTGDACCQMYECDMRSHCLHPKDDLVKYKSKEVKSAS